VMHDRRGQPEDAVLNRLEHGQIDCGSHRGKCHIRIVTPIRLGLPVFHLFDSEVEGFVRRMR
jgi:hypothetical protein